MENANKIAREVVDSAYQVHIQLGPGLFETVYEVALEHELSKRGLNVVRQKPIPVIYDGIIFDEGFRADLIVNDSLIIELKSIEKVTSVHKKQLLTYLKMAEKKLGLLINFGNALIKDGIFRIANGI